MAHYEEPMDIDIDSEFDNKENSLHHSNVYQQMPCTEKGYEELDVSDLNMKLRCSMTPVSSPMSKSYTANCVDFKRNDSNDDITNANLTQSYNSTITRSQVLNKSVKPMPLQSIITDYSDNTRNASNPIVATSAVQNNTTVVISNINEGNEEILSAPSSPSSLTPSSSATTPTKEIPRRDGGSPIMRGLKTVLNMFRSSQSPIPPGEVNLTKYLSPNTLPPVSPQGTQTVLASTPISAHRCKDGNVSKCNSPHKESIVFNEDLEKELLWKDETTILFSEEKIPIHKLFLKQSNIIDSIKCDKNKEVTKEHLNSSLEYMDVSYDKTDANNAESEGEFLDCETTFTDTEMQKGSIIIRDKDQNRTDVTNLLPENIESSIGAGETCERNENCNSLNIADNIESQQNSDLILTTIKKGGQSHISENLNDTIPCNNIKQELAANNYENAPLFVNDTHKTLFNEINTANKTFDSINDNQKHLQNDNDEIIILNISKSDNENNIAQNSTSTINVCENTLQELVNKTDTQISSDTISCSNGNQHIIGKNETYISDISLNADQISDSNVLSYNKCHDSLTETNITTTKKQESVQEENIACNLNSATDLRDTCINKNTVKSDQGILEFNTSGGNNLNLTNILPDTLSIEESKKKSIINFEKIGDPYATQTKIRLSPPLESPNKTLLAEDKEIKSNTNEFNLQLENTETENATLKEIDDIKADNSSLNNEVTNYHQECEEVSVNKKEIKNNIDDGVLSENNTYVSNSGADLIGHHLGNLDDTNYSTSKLKIYKKSRTSPKITSKGHNFNFEEIGDPFATKTKIRLSPPLDSPNKICLAVNKEIKSNTNEFKLQLENTETGNVSLNEIDDIKTDNSSLNNDKVSSELKASEFTNKKISLDNLVSNDHLEHDPSNMIESNIICTDMEQNTGDNNPSPMESVNNSISGRTTSSSEQSAYLSVATSCENEPIKNVFNIPEIDGTNFYPLTTKCQMCCSSQYNNEENDCVNVITKDKIEAKEQSIANDHQECINTSNISSSSKATDDKNITVLEIDTEDEDTIEGPFFGAEDIETDEKMSVFDFDDDNLMQSTDLPTQDNKRDIESNELFIDAKAFEFLLSQNTSNVVTSSGRESLFLKFDPLFARRVSNDGVLASLKNVQRKQFTPKKETVAQQINTTFGKPGPSLNLTHDLKADSTLEVTRDNFDTSLCTPMMPIHPANNTLEVTTDDLNITVSKPMMIVPPAVNPIITLKTKPATPVNSNRRSITFTSPAIAVIDRLLSLSENNSLLGEDSNMMETNRDQSEADIALTQLRELHAEKKLHAYTLRSESKELKDRLLILESKMRMLEAESEDRLKKINELTETLTKKTKINKNMAAVVEEYERTIASLIAETEQDKKRHNEERITLKKERDEQTAHLASMEVSFNDIHSKYEKSKQIILSCKSNEDTYKKSIKEFEENIAKMQSNYELLKQHATSKLNHANQELEKMNRAHDAEVLKLNAMIKRKDLHITSLEETLSQKTKVNEELTAICDELINKVG